MEDVSAINQDCKVKKKEKKLNTTKLQDFFLEGNKFILYAITAPL